MSDHEPYDPLNERNLGASVAEALLERDVTRLDKLTPFVGGGLYAIYYTGTFAPYASLAARNRDNKFEWPIYVGKAGDSRTRTGGGRTGPRLYARIAQHRESIRQADNLDVADFYCRALVVKDIWIPLGEALLLTKFAPLWNRMLDGFGNHDPGAGRVAGVRPRWDTLHPGRNWASKYPPRPETTEQLASEAQNLLESATVPAKPRFLAS